MIQYFVNGVCQCGKKLTPLKRDKDGCWEIVECSCGEWYDTSSYQKLARGEPRE